MKSLYVGAVCVFSAAAACAQSPVEVFGVLDVGISHYRVGGGQRGTGMSQHGNTSSRFGIRGKEDLGGGRALQFWLEGGVDPASPGAFSFARRSTLGLQTEWGEVRLGRDYTPTYNMMSSYAGPWVTNGVGESLLYRARAVSHDKSNAGQSTNVRSSNAINYLLPKNLGGVYGQFMYGSGDDGLGRAGRYVGGRLGYKARDWSVGVGYNTARGGDNSPAKTPRDVRNFSLGASYDLPFGELKALYISDRIEMPLGDKKLTGFSIGWSLPVKQGELRASYGRVKYDYATDQAKAQKVALGYVHTLSKRTALYTTVAYVDNDQGAKFVAGGGLDGVANKSSMGVDVGIRHRF